jgi:hypothetical protein
MLDKRIAMKTYERKPMSPETLAAGKKFITALIDDGHSYESMKGNFLFCMTKTALDRCGGVIAQAADLLRTHRNRIFDFLRDYPEIKAQLVLARNAARPRAKVPEAKAERPRGKVAERPRAY